MRKVTSFLLFFLLVLFTSINAQSSYSVVAEPMGYGAMFYNHGSHVARTSDDKLFVVWADIVGGQIVYSQYDASFQIWSPAATISNAPVGGTANDNAVASDDNGNLYVVWNQENPDTNYAIMFSKYNGSTWSTPVDLTGSILQNEEPNVAVGSDGKVFVVWNTDSEADDSEWILCVNSTDGGANWSSPPDTISSSDGILGGTSIETARVNLARGSAGKMVATWFERENGGSTDEIFMAQYDGAQWLDEMFVTVDDSTINNRYSQAALDNLDNIYIVWRGRPGSGYGLVMKNKAWSEVSWPETPNVIVPSEFAVSRPAMVIDENNNLYVAYERDVPADTTYDLDEIAIIASADGGVTWTDQAPISRPDHDAGYVGMEPRVTSSGIDLAWREGYHINDAAGSGDSVSVVYGHVDLSILGLEDIEIQVAKNFTLEQNYPNPFNPSTQINFTIGEAGTYSLVVYNVLGEQVKNISKARLIPGQYTAEWDGTNNLGKNAASGVYFYKLLGKNLSITKKMVLMR